MHCDIVSTSPSRAPNVSIKSDCWFLNFKHKFNYKQKIICNLHNIKIRLSQKEISVWQVSWKLEWLLRIHSIYQTSTTINKLTVKLNKIFLLTSVTFSFKCLEKLWLNFQSLSQFLWVAISRYIFNTKVMPHIAIWKKKILFP